MNTFNVGSASVDITPPLTIPYLGYVPRQAYFEGVHDPLYAKAIVADDGSCRIAIVVGDSIGWSRGLMGAADASKPDRDFIAEVRDRVHRRCGIPPDHVMIAATHAHSTPETLGIRRLLDHPGAAEWLEVLADQLASAVVMADRDRGPAQLKVAVGQADGIGWSRRIIGQDGGIYQWANRPSDDQIADAGARDPEVTVLFFERLNRRPGTALTHFACHPVTVQVQPLVSADFPGAAMTFVEQADMGCAHSLYLQGAAGSINPVRSDTRDFEDVRRYGQILAGEVIKQLGVLAAPDYPVSPVLVRAASETLVVPSRELPPAGPIEEQHRKGEEAVRNATTEEERMKAARALLRVTEQLERVRRGDAPVQAEVQVMRIGDIALVGIPGEPFAELGLALKQSHHRVLCVGYTNGYLGYIAPPSAFEQGGYEVSLGTWSIVGPAAFGQMVETGRSLVEKLWYNFSGLPHAKEPPAS